MSDNELTTKLRAECDRLEQVALTQQAMLKRLETRLDKMRETNIKLNKELGRLLSREARDASGTEKT